MLSVVVTLLPPLLVSLDLSVPELLVSVAIDATPTTERVLLPSEQETLSTLCTVVLGDGELERSEPALKAEPDKLVLWLVRLPTAFSDPNGGEAAGLLDIVLIL
jgi:hypothetical protein